MCNAVVLVLIFLLTVCASLIQRVCGFGFGIFVMMFFPYFLPSYGVATTMSGMLAGSAAMIIVLQGWRHIRWKMMFTMLAVNIIVSFIAIKYMASLADDIVKRCFGAMFVLIALYYLLFEKSARLPNTHGVKLGLGALSGIMGGMFAMPGPPLVLYYINNIDDKREYIVTMQAFSVLLNIFYTAFRTNVGFIDDDILLWWGVGIVGAFIGTSIGVKLTDAVNGETLKRIVFAMLLVSGISAML